MLSLVDQNGKNWAKTFQRKQHVQRPQGVKWLDKFEDQRDPCGWLKRVNRLKEV